MKTTKNIVLFSSMACLCMFQRESKAQWVENGKFDSYASEQERLQALDQSLTILEKSKPMVDLRSSIQKKDFGVVGYMGVGFATPGFPIKQHIYMVKRGIRSKVLKGSNDVLPGNFYDRLSKVSINYMKPYNEALWRYMISESKRKKSTRRK